MSLTLQIIDEFVGLFKNRGYDEKSLNNPDRPGFIAEQLSLKIRMAIDESLTWNENSSFELWVYGFPERHPNLTYFTMKFEFDIEKSSLEISQLVVKYGEYEDAYKLKNSYDLPDSKIASDKLLNKIQLPRKHKGNQRRLDDGENKLGL